MKSKPEPGAPPTAAELRERTLRLLARREHSRVELERKLGQAGFAAEDIAPLLDEFETRNWLSDRRYAESYVADHRARAGGIKLAYELKHRGIADTVIEEVLRENRDSELERAQAVWLKKFGTPPANSQDKVRQMRFMLGRGFSPDIIRRVLIESDATD